MPAFDIHGERVTLPVQIREASAISSMFAVPAAPVRCIIGYSGLAVFEPLPGTTICSLAFIRYIDGDLGPYHEFAVAYLIRPPASAPGRRVGVFIHWLPVNQSFTLEAGRTIWGFPKEMASLEISGSGGRSRCAWHGEAGPIVGLRAGGGLPTPGWGAGMAIDAYCHLAGTTRRVRWQMRPAGVRARPGGARLVLGEHPVADELRTLGLPKPALCTSEIRHLGMMFDGAQEVS